MDQTLYYEFLKYIDSVLRSDKILPLEDTARSIRDQFHKFFVQPSFEEESTRTELEECRKKYIDLYNPIKKLIQAYETFRGSYDMEGMKKKTLGIMGRIEDNLDRAISKIELEIGKLQEDKQIEIGEESKYIALESDKKAKRANLIAIIALIIAVTFGLLEIFNVI